MRVPAGGELRSVEPWPVAWKVGAALQKGWHLNRLLKNEKELVKRWRWGLTCGKTQSVKEPGVGVGAWKSAKFSKRR